jgi:hypothetical protein
MYFLFSFPLLLHLNIFLSTLFSGTLNISYLLHDKDLSQINTTNWETK